MLIIYRHDGEAGLIYTRPYHRISPYLVGLITGYILFVTKSKLKLPKVTQLLIFCSSVREVGIVDIVA